MRRPSRAIIVAFVVLSVFATALLAAPAGMAQEIDPLEAIDQSLDGGSVAAPMDVEAGLEDAIEAGGVPAVLEPPHEPVPSPAPAPNPQSDVPPPLPDTGTPSETAPAPAPESQPTDTEVEDATPAAPVAPINLNVDIRVLSPGDNGDVTQEITVPGSTGHLGGGPPAQPLPWTWIWIWNWNWTTPAVDEEVEDVAEVVLGEVLGESPGDPGQMFADTPLEQPAPIEPQEARPAPQVDHSPSPRPGAAAPGGVGPGESRFVGATPHLLLTVAGNSDGAAAVVADAAGAADRRQSDRGHAPAPEQAPPVLPSAAASSVGGGSSAPFAVAVLGLLCLLAPRALELARSRHRTLSSQLSSSRLERPG